MEIIKLDSRGHTEVLTVRTHQTVSKGHTEGWKSISPTQRRTKKYGSPSLEVKGPYEALESTTPTGGSKLKVWSPSALREGSNKSVRLHNPNPKGHKKAWECITPTSWAAT